MSLKFKTPQEVEEKVISITAGDVVSLIYHDLFDYALTPIELKRWTSGGNYLINAGKVPKLFYDDGFIHLQEDKNLSLKRKLRKSVSEGKLVKARQAAKTLKKIPFVKLVAVTGSLAMKNAKKEDDIDLLIIVKKDTLWLTRIVAYLSLYIGGFTIRRPGEIDEEDKLCLNMWLEEQDLVWPPDKRNIFTAHEISHIVPLVNKDKTYQKFLYQNKWVKKYWPRATRITKVIQKDNRGKQVVLSFMENIAFHVQYFYGLRKRKPNELVTKTRAFFHPIDWSENVSKLLENRLQ